MGDSEISADRVRRLASLARLALPDDRVEEMRSLIAPVLGYVRRLDELDLTGVEPMTHPGDATSIPADDAPGAMLPNRVLMELAPRPTPPFVMVPKVIGEGGAA